MEVLIKPGGYLLIPMKYSRIITVYQKIYIQPYDWN